MGSDNDAQSPTTLVMNYLRSKGLPPNSQNVRAALTENARDPTLIPGLRNQAPPGEDDSSSFPHASGPGVGQSGNAANRIEGGGSDKSLPLPPPAPSTDNGASSPADAPKTTSAAPQAAPPPPSNGMDWESILGLGATGAAALANGARGGGEFVGNSGPPPFAAMPDTGLPVTGAGGDPNADVRFNSTGDPIFPGEPGYEQAYPQNFTAGQPPFAPSPAPQAPPPGSVVAGDPMQAALAKAVGGPDMAPGMPQIGAGGGSGGAMVPSSAIPMPDATSGPTIIPQNTGSGPTLITPRTGAPMPDAGNMPTNPGLMEDFMRFIRGVGARR